MAEEVNKVDDIIKKINGLSHAEKRELTIKVRTTPEGIKAYTSFLYGYGGLPSKENEDEHDEDNDTSPHANDPNAKESQDNNNPASEEDWL
tara:strand:+ start:17193 stop:17465 length:273 start_codon:yes stop_codon:yes gene_type:complete